MSISGTVVQRADVRFVEAAEPLRELVGCFWVITAEAGAVIRLVPDGSTTIASAYHAGQPAEWVLRGPLAGPAERRFSERSQLVGIRLRPGVAHLVHGTPVHAIVGGRVALPLGTEAGAPEQWVDALQRFLLARLTSARLHPTVEMALREIEREHGCVRIPELAARCGVSTRQLHRLMRTWVGFGAKGYASVIRFQATLHAMEDAPDATAAEIASEAGYFDQAHLALDVARFAGATPRRLAVADFSKTRCDDLP